MKMAPLVFSKPPCLMHATLFSFNTYLRELTLSESRKDKTGNTHAERSISRRLCFFHAVEIRSFGLFRDCGDR